MNDKELNFLSKIEAINGVGVCAGGGWAMGLGQGVEEKCSNWGCPAFLQFKLPSIAWCEKNKEKIKRKNHLGSSWYLWVERNGQCLVTER